MTLGILLRAAILLAIAAPVFAATGFRLAPWQIFVVALVGSGLGQLAWMATKARSRRVQIAVTALGVVVAAGGALTFTLRRSDTQASTHLGLIVVANRDRPSLTQGDVDALGARVGAVAPVAHHDEFFVAEDESVWKCRVHGTTPAYLDLRGWRVASGAAFTQGDLDAAAKVVILGATPAKQLFGGADPVGRIVRVGRVPFTVAGVLAPKSVDDDEIAVVPLTTFFAKLRGGIRKTFDGVILISPAADPEVVRAILRDRHRLAPGDDDDFVLRDLR